MDHQYCNSGVIQAIDPLGSYSTRLDLGFHVFHTALLTCPANGTRFSVDESVFACLSHDSNGTKVRSLSANCCAPRVRRWSYPAHLLRVLDGDTIDAVVHVGFGIAVEERFRLAWIAAPEINRGTAAEREHGRRACEYLRSRIAEHDGKMTLISDKQGKWRRWLAWILLEPRTPSLNAELVSAGLASYV